MHRNKVTWAFLALVLVAFVAFGALAEEAVGVITGGKLHLRQAPSHDAKILATYTSGTYVSIIASEGDWYEVQLEDGAHGYMEAKYVSIPSEGVVENGSRYVNLRSAPTKSAAVIGEYPTGTRVKLLSESAGWMQVEIDGTQGYMAAEFIHETLGIAPLPVAQEKDAADVLNPYELPTNGDASVTHQVGVGQSEVGNEDKLSYTVYYPQLGIAAADEAVAAWVQQTISDTRETAVEAEDGESIELTVQYDTYLAGERFIGVLETGFLDSMMFAHPSDLVFTLNADITTGALLDAAEIFTEGREVDVLALVKDQLQALGDLADEDLAEMDESWLKYTLIKPDGVAVILPRSEYLASAFGTVSVELSYEELGAAGLLALDVTQEVIEDAAQPTATPDAADASGRTIDPSKPMIALTFDDGPSDYTEHILSILTANGARATFCMVGNRIENYRDVVVAVAAQGSEIATHTWSHKNLTTISSDAIHSQLQRSVNAIEAVAGQPVHVLRPPYGAVDSDVKAVCRQMGLTLVNWSIDTEDWKTNNADATYNAIMKHVKNGSIILCHDVKPSTSVAMERVIPELVRQGYQLVTLSELLSFSQTHGQPGTLYNHLDTSHLPSGS